MRIFKEFRFEAAHWLPRVAEGHKCRRMHGHSYRCVVHVRGAVDPEMGWVIDFAELRDAVEPLRRQLDHYVLNEVDGLENPTCEAVARWIWRRLAAGVPGLDRVELYETDSSGCVYEGEDE